MTELDEAYQEPVGSRWRIVLAGVLIHLCLGSIYAYGVLRNPLQEYFESMGLAPTAMEMTWPFIVFLAFFSITMPLAGPYIERYGPMNVSIVGGLLCGLGWIAASFAQSPLMLIPLYGIIGGVGVGIAYGAPIAASALWFPDKRGLAVGLTVLGFGFSSAVITYVSRFLLDIGWGIMSIFVLFGFTFLTVSLLFSMMLRFPPKGWRPSGKVVTASQAEGIEITRYEMKRNAKFKGLYLCYTIGTLAGLTAIGIAGPVGAEVFANAGMEAGEASGLVFALILPFALFNGLGRPVFGSLTDRLTPKVAAMLTFVLISIACFVMYVGYSSVWAYIICFSILWGCLGGWLAIAPTTTATFFGMRNYSKNYGIIYTAYGVGAIVGGIVSAQAKDILGDFQPFFLVVAILGLIGLLVAWRYMDIEPLADAS